MTNRFLHVPATGLIFCLFLAGCGPGKGAREVHIAASANLSAAMDEIGQGFRKKTGIAVVRTMGATAQLAQQIENGAPVDVFLSADTEHVDALIAAGLADRDSRAIYVRGRLALWAPLRPDITSLSDLASPTVREVGCARPELAPYGAAAIAALKKEGLWKAVEPKLVYGQSISAAKQFADSGNAAASFTALSLVFNLPGHFVVVDDRLHPPLDQALCVIKRTSAPDAARGFRDYVLGPEAQAVFARYGYTLGVR